MYDLAPVEYGTDAMLEVKISAGYEYTERAMVAQVEAAGVAHPIVTMSVLHVYVL